MDEFVRFPCNACGKSLKAPAHFAGRKSRCACGNPVVVPANAPTKKKAPKRRPDHTLKTFRAGSALFWGIVTFNVFAVMRLMWLHGRFPKRRPDDPSATDAIVRCFYPFFNMYWAPFALDRLVTRLNEQRQEWGLPQLRIEALVFAFVICCVSGIFGLPLAWALDDKNVIPFAIFIGPFLNLFVIVPLLVTVVQNGINGLIDAGRASEAAHPEAFLLQTELKWRIRQRVVWGIYLCFLMVLDLAIVSLFIYLRRKETFFEPNLPWEVFWIHFWSILLPLTAVAVPLFVRAGIMGRRRRSLDESPSRAEAVVYAERRTTRTFQLTISGSLFVLGFALIAYVARSELPHYGNRWTSYFFKDILLQPLLTFTVPAWTIALHLLLRARQRAIPAADSARAPVMGLQAGPTSWRPMVAGMALALLVIGAARLWPDNGSIATGSGPSTSSVFDGASPNAPSFQGASKATEMRDDYDEVKKKP